jgi:hypothetical protein
MSEKELFLFSSLLLDSCSTLQFLPCNKEESTGFPPRPQRKIACSFRSIALSLVDAVAVAVTADAVVAILGVAVVTAALALVAVAVAVAVTADAVEATLAVTAVTHIR